MHSLSHTIKLSPNIIASHISIMISYKIFCPIVWLSSSSWLRWPFFSKPFSTCTLYLQHFTHNSRAILFCKQQPKATNIFQSTHKFFPRFPFTTLSTEQRKKKWICLNQLKKNSQHKHATAREKMSANQWRKLHFFPRSNINTQIKWVK